MHHTLSTLSRILMTFCIAICMNSCSYVQNIFYGKKDDGQKGVFVQGGEELNPPEPDEIPIPEPETPAEIIDEVITQDQTGWTTFMAVVDDRNEVDADGNLLPELYTVAYSVFPDTKDGQKPTNIKGHRLGPCDDPSQYQYFENQVVGGNPQPGDKRVIASINPKFEISRTDTSPVIPCMKGDLDYVTVWYYEEDSRRDFYIEFTAEKGTFYRVPALFVEALGFQIIDIVNATEDTYPTPGSESVPAPKYALNERPAEAWSFMCTDLDRCADQPANIQLVDESLAHQSLYPGQTPDPIAMQGLDPEGHKVTWKLETLDANNNSTADACAQLGITASEGAEGVDYTYIPTAPTTISDVLCEYRVTVTSNDLSTTRQLSAYLINGLGNWCNDFNENRSKHWVSPAEKETIKLIIRNSDPTVVTMDPEAEFWTSGECSALETAWTNGSHYRIAAPNPIEQLLPGSNGLDEQGRPYYTLDDISPLALLADLREVYLPGRGIATVDPLKVPTKLEHINLTANQIADISPIMNLPNLRTLEIYGNQITTVTSEEDDRWPLLETLDLGFNPINDASLIMQLVSLKDLYMQYASLTLDKLIAFDDQLSDAINVDLSLNDISSAGSLSSSGSGTAWTAIGQLSLAYNSDISILDVSQMTQLTFLDITATQVNCEDLIPGTYNCLKSSPYDFQAMCNDLDGINKGVNCDE